MNSTDSMFIVTVDDVQQIAAELIGRSLTIQELQQVKLKLDSDWVDNTKLVIRMALEE